MCKLDVFKLINSGTTLGSIDANALQEAYAYSDEFWNKLSLVLANADKPELVEDLREHCLAITDSLLDQAIEEQRQINEDVFWADKADDQD